MIVPETIYRIDQKDRLTFVNEEFNEFALANDVPELTGNSVLTREIWDFIPDSGTRYLYGQLIKQVREGHNVRFEFRCDSRDLRRDGEMRMSLHTGGEVEFKIRILSAVPRKRQDGWNAHAKSSGDLICVCSWCDRVKLDDARWGEIDEAIIELRILSGEFLPRISHGICEDCYTRMTRILTELN